MIVFFRQNMSQTALSGLYTVCLTFSLVKETQILHTQLGNNIKIFNIIFTICAMEQMDMGTKYTDDCVIDFLLFSGHDIM